MTFAKFIDFQEYKSYEFGFHMLGIHNFIRVQKTMEKHYLAHGIEQPIPKAMNAELFSNIFFVLIWSKCLAQNGETGSNILS
jgi:hypothetical protein